MNTKDFEKIKVAITHDVLIEEGGSEKVLQAFLEIFPNADIFLGVVNPKCELFTVLENKIKKYFIKIPSLKFLSLLKPIVYLFWESLDFKNYDLVISSSGSFSAKSVITSPSTLHICYCHTPPKYLYKEFSEGKYWVKKTPSIKNLFTHILRIYDYISSQRPDYFIANSASTQKRIEKYYRRDSEVIYPPVEFSPYSENLKIKSNYYLYLGRLYKQKGIELLIETFNKLDRELLIAGTGPGIDNFKNISNENIKFLGFVDEFQKKELLLNASAYINATVDEDFGIAPVEALARGTPVIAYKSGGLKETIIENTNGIFFNKYNSTSLKKAILTFEKKKFNSKKCHESAKKYSKKLFKIKITNYIKRRIIEYENI